MATRPNTPSTDADERICARILRVMELRGDRRSGWATLGLTRILRA